MENERKLQSGATLAELQSIKVTPELSKKFKLFLEQVVQNKDIYFSSQTSEGSENSEGSESSEDSEASEDSEGTESEFFESLLAVNPGPDEWASVLAFSNVVSGMLNRR